MEARIWNKSELEKMPEWVEDESGDFLHTKKKCWITKGFMGKSIDTLIEMSYPVFDEMIAKTEKEFSINELPDFKHTPEPPEPIIQEAATQVNNTPVSWLKNELTKIIPNKINNRHLILDKKLAAHFKNIFEAALEMEKERLEKGEIGITLENGTTLRVGERYKYGAWGEGVFIEIIAISEKSLFCKDEDGDEGLYDIYDYWLPYTEPKEEPKPLEGYQEYFVLTNKGSLTSGFLNDEQLKEMQEMVHGDIRKIYTRQEAIEAGLKI
jgi:hypothetical protein